MIQTLCFIGGGNMAASLISGLVADGYDSRHILVSDPDREQLANLAARYGVRTTDENTAAVLEADVVILAVKPQVLQPVAIGLREALTRHKPLFISIAAGVREAALSEWLGGGVPLVRTMPNTPAMIQSGATVLHAAEGVTESQRDLAENILRSVGLTRWVEEEAMMDTVTALSGSGPAYFFLVMEAMEAAARGQGMGAETARLLTLQTALGAARMAMESSASPGELREQVTSPGGTTEQALKVLEEGGLRELFQQALQGAHDRSVELSTLIGSDSRGC